MYRNTIICTVASATLSWTVAAQAQPQGEHAARGVGESRRIENQLLETVMVYGRQPNDTVADIPQSVSVFDRDQIDLTAAVNVGDIVQFVPTASRNGSTLNSFGDDYLIRGFGANQIVNGLGFNRLAHARDLASVERVEVLKGPAAVLYGQMEPGAVINVVTKQPLDSFQAKAGVELGSYDSQRYTMDVTAPLASNVGGRLNLAYSDADTFIDFWDKQRLFVAPNLTVDLSPATQLVLEGTYTETDWGSFQNGNPASGAFLPNPNGEYDEGFNPDEEDIGFTERDSADINLRLVHRLNDQLRARASYTYTRNERSFKEMFVIGLQEDQRTIDRALFVGDDSSDNDRNLLLDLAGETTTGLLRHKFIVGYNHRDYDSVNPTRFALSTPLDMFNPQYGLAPDVDPEFNRFHQQFESSEAFIQNRVALGERLHILAGVRYTDSEQDTRRVTASGDISRDQLDETHWTTQVGFLYDIADSASLYANRSEAFVPQFGSSSTGRPFDAEESVQYEIGSRLALGDSGMEANIALFTITKENLTTADPDNPEFDAALGEVESRGIELSASGYLLPDWFLGLAYGYTDTEILKNFDGLEGNALRNVPKNTASVQTRYDIAEGPLRGLGLGANVVYVDDRYGDDENSFELPAYTRIDLGLYYTVNESLEVDLLFNNITDEDIYVEGYSVLRVIREPGQTVLARLTLRY